MLDCSQLLDGLMDRESAPCLVHKAASVNTVILADCCLPAQHKDVGTHFALQWHMYKRLSVDACSLAPKLLVPQMEEDFVKANPEWIKELEIMVQSKVKAEIQALSSFGFQYLSQVYLPLKLQEGDWI